MQDSLTCPFCAKTFVKQTKLDIHVRIHTGERPFVCQICVSTFRRSDHLRRHVATVHHTDPLNREEWPFECESCKQRYKTRQHLIRHERIHQTRTMYSCTECDASFTKKNQLQRHYLQIHNTRLKSFVCQQCDQRYERPSQLARHVQQKHTELPQYRCGHPHCDYLALTWHSLQQHVRELHQLTDLNCPICDKSFTTRKSLRGHIRDVHTDRKWTCSFQLGCDKVFTTKRNLMKHVRVEHVNNSNEDVRPFSCDHCKDSFSYKHVLQRHLLKCTAMKS